MPPVARDRARVRLIASSFPRIAFTLWPLAVKSSYMYAIRPANTLGVLLVRSPISPTRPLCSSTMVHLWVKPLVDGQGRRCISKPSRSSGLVAGGDREGG